MPRASIIIVEYNSRPFLERCLVSLQHLDAPGHFYEVVVVDNGSPTPVMNLEARFPAYRFMSTGKNLGFAGGNCAALLKCTGEFVVALNPDTEVEPSWLTGLLEPFADPKVGVVGCKMYYAGTTILQHAGGVVFPNGRSEHRGHGERDVGQYNEQQDVQYVCGASMAMRRTMLDQIGFFSTAYHPAYYEDTELCRRAIAAGYRVVYTPRAVLFHAEAAASVGCRTETFLRLYHTGRIRYVARNYSARELVTAFFPAEAEFFGHAPQAERRICLKAYWHGVLEAPRRLLGRGFAA